MDSERAKVASDEWFRKHHVGTFAVLLVPLYIWGSNRSFQLLQNNDARGSTKVDVVGNLVFDLLVWHGSQCYEDFSDRLSALKNFIHHLEWEFLISLELGAAVAQQTIVSTHSVSAGLPFSGGKITTDIAIWYVVCAILQVFLCDNFFGGGWAIRSMCCLLRKSGGSKLIFSRWVLVSRPSLTFAALWP